MRSIFCLALTAFALLAAAADNAFNVPAGGYKFGVGQPTTVTWKPTTSGTVTLKLHKGSDITPESGIVLAASIANSGSYIFTPSPSLGAGNDYTIEIIDDTDPNNINFTPQFSIAGTTGSASSLRASATKSSSSSTSTGSTSRSSSSATSSESSTLTTRTSSTSSRSSPTSSATGTSQTTAAPNPNAAMSLKLPGGMLAAVFGVMAIL